MTGRFRIEALGASHDRSTFNCGSAALDKYLQQQASQDTKRLVSSCFVATETASGDIAGYYTLAATSILADEISTDVLKKLPRYPLLPAALIGRLAIDVRFQRLGLGGALIADAALRVINGDLKAFAVIVDAKDAKAQSFYIAQGFLSLSSRPLSLYLPLATLGKAARKSGN